MQNVHLTHKNDLWRLQNEGSNRSIKTFTTKDEAVSFSMKYMHKNGGSLKIHKQDGTIQEERTYPGKADPRRSRG